MASFLVGPTGRVDAIATSGDMPDRYVHHCIARAVRAMQFPAPTNGGLVGVNYPFTLSSHPRSALRAPGSAPLDVADE